MKRSDELSGNVRQTHGAAPFIDCIVIDAVHLPIFIHLVEVVVERSVLLEFNNDVLHAQQRSRRGRCSFIDVGILKRAGLCALFDR